MVRVLLLLLLISVSVNIWLLWHQFTQQQTSGSDTSSSTSQYSPPRTKSPSIDQQSTHSNTRSRTIPESQAQQSQLKHAQQLLREGQLEALASLLQHHLRQYPNDIDFLLLEAEYIQQTQPINYALNHYYSLLDLPLSDKQQRQLRNKIYTLASTHSEQLRQVQAWDILANFLEPLWQFDPYHQPYIEMLAECYARMQQAAPMENVLASLLPDAPQAERIRALFAQSNEQQTQPEIPTDSFQRGIALSRIGSQFIVPTRVGRSRFELLIDTGASTTVLSENAFARVRGRKRFIGEYLVNTAGGQVSAPIYQLSHLAIAEFSITDAAVVVLPMQGFEQADGLLGMNFLSQFTFSLDQQNAVLYLR